MDAKRLKQALLPSLRKKFIISQEDFEHYGVADYEKAFADESGKGGKISERRFRELVQRTRARDGGRLDWEKLEIYLPEKLALKPKPGEPQPEFPFVVQAINDGVKPDQLWRKVFEAEAELIKNGVPRARAARWLRAFIAERKPFGERAPAALLKMYDRRRARWQRGDCFDKRAGNGPDESKFTQAIEVFGWFVPAARFFYLLTNRGQGIGSMPEAIMQTISLPRLPCGWPEWLKRKLLKKLSLPEIPSCPLELREMILARRKAYQPLVPAKIARQIRVNPSVVEFYRSPREWSLNNLCAAGSQRRFFN